MPDNDAKLCPKAKTAVQAEIARILTIGPEFTFTAAKALAELSVGSCDRDRCEWWIGDTENCAVTVLGFARYLREVRND